MPTYLQVLPSNEPSVVWTRVAGMCGLVTGVGFVVGELLLLLLQNFWLEQFDGIFFLTQPMAKRLKLSWITCLGKIMFKLLSQGPLAE